MILFGPWIMSLVDRYYVYPKRLAKVQTSEAQYPSMQEHPSHLPPAIVAQLVSFSEQKPKKGKSYTRFIVTLLDLVHRQKIFVTHRGDELFFSPLGDDSDLLPFEKTLIQFIKSAAGERLFISLTDLLIYIEANREIASEMRSGFLKEIAEDFCARGFYKEVSYEKSVHPMMQIGKVAVSGTVGVILGWLAGNIPLGLVTVGLSMVAVSLCTQVLRYKLPYLTEVGMTEKERWTAYAKYLSKLSTANRSNISNAEICEFAVYALALEMEEAFTTLSPVWREIAEDHPECILYESFFFKKLIQIDNSILISNVHSQTSK